MHKCIKCNVELYNDNWLLSCQKQHNYICRICNYKRQKIWRKNNKDKVNTIDRKYRRKCREKYTIEYKLKINKHKRMLEKIRRQKIKHLVFSHYCNGDIKCNECKFTNIKTLSIDHINNDGAKHRREIKCNTGTSFYQWLINNNYPEGFQVLCMNCQWIKRVTNKENGHLLI